MNKMIKPFHNGLYTRSRRSFVTDETQQIFEILHTDETRLQVGETAAFFMYESNLRFRFSPRVTVSHPPVAASHRV